MKSWPAISLVLVMAAWSAGLPLVADDTQPAPAAKSPVLSSPVEDTDQSDTRLDDLFPARSTVSLFGSDNSGSGPLPPPPPVNQRPDPAKSDWILMTPEEILGVKTPAEILHVQTSEQLDYDRKSPEERFMDRDSAAAAGTNGGGDGLVSGTSWLQADDAKRNSVDDSADSAFQNLKGMLTVDRSGNPFFQPVQSSGWSGTPAMVQPTDAEKARQKADMDAFHALLGEAPEKKETTAPVNNYESEAQRARDASAVNPLLANPYGTTYRPLADSAVKPVGLTPLSSWNTVKKKSAPPAWAPKPPPWLTPGPESTIVQRVGF